MQVRNEEQQLAEFRRLLDTELQLALARARGVQAFYEVKAKADGLPDDTAIHWILRAHVGTFERLATLLPTDRAPSSVDLLAGARHLFENLVWLKLFLIDSSWGTFFYAQLLSNRRDDAKRTIDKLNDEANLFLSFDEEDGAIIDDVLHDIGEIDEPSPEYVRERTAEMHRRKDELDRRARRTFALFHSAATFNGYGYQAHLLQTKQIPHWQNELHAVEKRIDALRTEIADEATFDRYMGKWNWRGEAQRVGMVAQYDYLYRLTSRLLHATPMSILTEKNLLESERMTLLEFMIVAVQDMFEAVQAFDFPGKIDAVFIEVVADNEAVDEPKSAGGAA